MCTCRKIAEDDKKGYFCKDNFLMRSRMNDIGEQIVQIVVPKSHRDRILTLSHEKWGHFGHKKMLVSIKRSFFWRGMGRDCKYHARSCKICQNSNKSTEVKAPMIEREISSVPFEKICLNIVGSLPNTRGGFRYILTYIDVATRWPEAVKKHNY